MIKNPNPITKKSIKSVFLSNLSDLLSSYIMLANP